MRLIDADTLRAEFTGNFQELWHYTGIGAMIDNAPTIEAVPVVHGEWKKSNEGVFICSQCNNGYKDQPTCMGEPLFEFCPVCGADIRKKV